jgi:hypothetical protein
MNRQDRFSFMATRRPDLTLFDSFFWEFVNNYVYIVKLGEMLLFSVK